MGNITGASLAPIYARLNGTANYHPYDAETFSDWSLEAGDLVKVVRGEENYKSPIHSSSLVWTGSPNMTLTSTGTQAREAVAKVSKKKYGRSGYGRRNNKQNNSMWHVVEETDEYWRVVYNDEFNGLRSTLEQTASYWRSTLDDSVNSLHGEIEQTASHWRSTLEDTANSLHSEIEQTSSYWRSTLDDSVNSLHGEIVQTASYWRSTLEDTANSLHGEIEQTASYWRSTLANNVSSLQSKIDQEANRIDLVVEGTGSNAHIRPAEIVTSINSQTGSSHVLIGADQVAISGRTTINDVFSIGERLVQVKLPMRVEGDIMAESITLRTHGGNGAQIDEDDIMNMITSASVSGNVLTLTPRIGDPITFSKATSLSGEWSGDNTGITATITVTATPQEESISSHVNLHINQNAAWITDPDGAIRARLDNTPYSNVTINSMGLASEYSNLSDAETRTSIYIEAVASNGAEKDDFLLTLAKTTYSNGNRHCVNLKDGNNIIGRVDTESVYEDGYEAVTISSMKLASEYSNLSDSETRTSIYIEAVASNGAEKDDFLLTLANTTYSSGNRHCINLKDGNSIIGRVDTESVYNEGYSGAHLSGVWDKSSTAITNSNRLTISKVATGSLDSLNYVISAASSISWVSSLNKFRATGQAKVDGTQRGDDATDDSGEITIVLNSMQGSGGGAYRTASVKNGTTAIITSGNITDYGDGYTAGNTAGQTSGYNSAHLSGTWDKSSSSISNSNRLTITKVSTGSINSLNYIVSASASIGWVTSLKKFRATAQAKVDGTQRGDNATSTSGEISIALNSIQGSGGGAYRTASVKNGDTAIVTSDNITDYGDGYTAGYNAGWNAACSLISRNGNSIIGPVTGKATATSGRTETKYTANYTASSHSYTAAKYTASSYTKESHSYTASSHSFTQATCKTNGANHTKYYYNGNFSGSIEYTPATDSYTASKHSYTASKYTASSFTAASHSYTASSFSWS